MKNDVLKFTAIAVICTLLSGCAGLDKKMNPCGHVWYSKEEAQKVAKTPECQQAMKENKRYPGLDPKQPAPAPIDGAGVGLAIIGWHL